MRFSEVSVDLQHTTWRRITENSQSAVFKQIEKSLLCRGTQMFKASIQVFHTRFWFCCLFSHPCFYLTVMRSFSFLFTATVVASAHAQWVAHSTILIVCHLLLLQRVQCSFSPCSDLWVFYISGDFALNQSHLCHFRRNKFQLYTILKSILCEDEIPLHLKN
jgi:hypothetical protein